MTADVIIFSIAVLFIIFQAWVIQRLIKEAKASAARIKELEK